MRFLQLLLADFAEHGTLKEKYDVEAGRSTVAADLRFGYTSNEVGFGWTNAAFLLLAAGLSPAAAEGPGPESRRRSSPPSPDTWRPPRHRPA